MKLQGIININGTDHRATLTIDDDNYNGVSRYRNGKWRAVIMNNGKQSHIGYYDYHCDAVEAVKARCNINSFRRPYLNRAGGAMTRGEAGEWIVKDQGLQCECATFGDAVLLLDTLWKHAGKGALVEAYTMPPGLIKDVNVLRAINAPAFEPTPQQIVTYRDNVQRLNLCTMT